MKKILLTITIILFNVHVYSQTVDFESAKRIASSFLMGEKENIQKNNPIVSSQHTIYGENGNPLLYIINFEENGFVIVSANQNVEPILAYSTTNEFPFDGRNSAAEDWAKAYAEGISHAVEAKLIPSDEIKNKWNEVEKGVFSSKEQKTGTTIVGPLLTSKWNQDRYYNEHCPDTIQSRYMSAYDNRTPNGCVAVAMAQIMYYHRYPRKGVGGSNYICNGYGRLAANYATADYNYEAMSDVATGYSGALAQLIYHSGVAVRMNYKSDGSGAYSHDARVALSARFSYKTSLRLLEQRNYDDSTWRSILKADLDRGLPVYYSGCNGATGVHGCHAFVCDGYNESDGKFHFNWGWGGSSDGWFALSNMNYTINCSIITGIEPSNYELNFFSGTKVLTATYGSFIDGSPSQGEYKNNTNCSWLIAPQDGRNTTAINLKIAYFSTEENNDIVTVYKGDTINPDSIVAVLSGNLSETYTIPTIYSSKAFVTFTSNDDITARGFKFTYTSQRESSNFCPNNSSPIVLIESTGTIESTQEDMMYDDVNICYWALKPINNQNVAFTFTKFDLESGDFVDVYAWNGTTDFSRINYYKDARYRFTKENPPVIGEEYLVSSPGAYIRFRADNDLNASGFTLNWHTTNTAVSDLPTGITSVSVYPNPAHDNVRIQVEMLNPESLQFSLYNVIGQEIYKSNPVEVTQQYNQDIDLNGFAKGIYFLKITTSKGMMTKKIIIQ